IVDDAAAEGVERFQLRLSKAVNAVIVNGAGTVTIGAGDGPPVGQPRISESSRVVGEGDGYVDEVVSLSAPGQSQVTVDYTTGDAWASRFGDYVAVSGTLTFAPGETTKLVRVELGDDGGVENMESFSVGLSNAVNAAIATGFARLSLVDNDSVVGTP